jgi:hypothetical protein
MRATEMKTSRGLLMRLGLVLLLASTAGCSMLATGAWVINPKDVDAEYDGLNGKRVAVVCRAPGGLSYTDHDVPPLLSEMVSHLLAENVDKITIVPQSEIRDWTDHHELDSYKEFGLAMKADRIVVLDLENFSVRQGKTTLQGDASVEVAVYDIASGDVIKRLGPIESRYPPNNSIPADISNDRFERRFRQTYIGVLGHQIARRFYAHDSREVVKMDRFYAE